MAWLCQWHRRPGGRGEWEEEEEGKEREGNDHGVREERKEEGMKREVEEER